MAAPTASQKHRQVHHLSREAGDPHGWVESITGLTADQPATDLLNNGSTSKQKAHVADGVGAAEAGSSVVHAMSGLSLEQERDMRVEHALEILKADVSSTGEALITIGGPGGWGPELLTEAELAAILKRVGKVMGDAYADITVLRQRKVPSNSEAAESATADVVVRLRANPGAVSPAELRVAIIGNVDSGKSTMVGVLTRHILDDGRGFARSKVFKHGHEEATGRTSSIGQHNLCLDSKCNILNDQMFRSNSSAEYIARASKVVTLVDLAGHERYFKTTAYGLTGHMPDYACLIVGANAGIVGMCKEHMGVALALKVPVFFVVTKVDICPEHVLKHTLATLQAILKKPGVKKKPFMNICEHMWERGCGHKYSAEKVRNKDDVLTCARHMHTDSLAPVFLTSSVTGEGLELVRLFYNLLPQRHKWHDKMKEHAEFIIDETFGVPGVGTVIAGTVKRGVITTNANLMLGPDVGDGTFKLTAIKSIQYKRLPVTRVVAGQTAALALKKVKRNQVRKGMVLVDERAKPKASWEFDADIAILTHSTTIQPRYQAVIHCEIVRQAARVIAMDKERLRSGDRACVRFRFLQRPEYLTAGTRLVFREGKTKGIGMVVGTE